MGWRGQKAEFQRKMDMKTAKRYCGCVSLHGGRCSSSGVHEWDSKKSSASLSNVSPDFAPRLDEERLNRWRGRLGRGGRPLLEWLSKVSILLRS